MLLNTCIRLRGLEEVSTHTQLTQDTIQTTVVKYQSLNCLSHCLACESGITSAKNARKKYTPTTHCETKRRKDYGWRERREEIKEGGGRKGSEPVG